MMRTFKSITIRILVALITFSIGLSCAKLTIVFRESHDRNGEAEKIVDDNANVGRGKVASRGEEEPSGITAWDGYIKRGKIYVRAAGTTWSVKGVAVSHTEEIYGSSEVARYVLGKFRGEWHPSSEVAPRSAACEFKVVQRRERVRIAWVSDTDLHYLETSSYSAAITLLASWGTFKCG